MNVYRIVRRQIFHRTVGEVFEFFESPQNLSRITPPWLNFRIPTPIPIVMKVGALIDYTIRWLGYPVRWKTLFTSYEPPNRFADEQTKGPYSLWHHEHTFRSTKSGTEMTDVFHYALPGGFIRRIVHTMLVRRQLEQIFDY